MPTSGVICECWQVLGVIFINWQDGCSIEIIEILLVRYICGLIFLIKAFANSI
jgi:hypothetical protein